MKILRIVLLLLLMGSLLSRSESARASHILGADLTYRWVDTLTYEFTLKFYRDCRGVALTDTSFTCTISCSNGGTTRKVTMVRDSIREITPLCDSAGTYCDPRNSKVTGKGIEEHVYKVVIDLRKSPYDSLQYCCGIRFDVRTCCRSNSITTGPSGYFYTYALLDICRAPTNSSPQFGESAITSICCNQPFYWNLAAADTAEFDSLSYAFAQPLSGWNQKVTYSGKYTYKLPFTVYDPTGRGTTNPNTNPPTGLYFDPQTGDLIFTPTNCNEVTVVAIEVKEWRKDSSGKFVQIGTTRRDMQFEVSQCPLNNPPILNGPFSYSVCEETTLSFNITTDDKVFIPPPPAPKPPADTLEMTWNKGIPMAEFKILDPTARLKTGRFSWTPPRGTSRTYPYDFAVKVQDDHCPERATSIRAFHVQVRPKSKGRTSIRALSCSDVELKSIPDTVFRSPLKYIWNLLDSNGNAVYDPGVFSFRSNGSTISKAAVDTLHLLKGGKYYVRHQLSDANGCPVLFIDTLTVGTIPQIKFTSSGDTFTCDKESVELSAYLSDTLLPLKYTWSTGESSASVRFKVNDTLAHETVWLEVENANRCANRAAITVLKRPRPFADLGLNKRICSGDSIHLKSRDSLAWWDDPRDTSYLPRLQGSLLNRIVVFRDGKSTDTLGSSKSYWVSKEGTYEIFVRDSLGCTARDSMRLDRNEYKARSAVQDSTVCPGSDVLFHISDRQLIHPKANMDIYWFNINGSAPVSLGTGDSLNVTIRTDLKVWLSMKVTELGVTCYSNDTFDVGAHSVMGLQMPGPKEVCCNGDLDLRSLASQGGGIWNCTSDPTLILNGDSFDVSSACSHTKAIYWLSYNLMDTNNQCVAVDSFPVTVRPLPRVGVRDLFTCQSKKQVELARELVFLPSNLRLGTHKYNCLNCGSTYNWSDILHDRNNGFPYPDHILRIDTAHFPFQGAEETLEIEFEYTDVFGCINRDTATVRVVRDIEIRWEPFSGLCRERESIDLKQYTGVKPSDGYWMPYDTSISGYLNYSEVKNAFYGGVGKGDSIDLLKIPEGGGRIYLRYTHSNSGCDFVRDTTLTVFKKPSVKIDTRSLQIEDSTEPFRIKQRNPFITLSGIPEGGVWTADYPRTLNRDVFHPSSAPLDLPFRIYYTFTDSNTCSATDTVYVEVFDALRAEDIDPGEAGIYPNPLWIGETLYIDGSFQTVRILDLKGRLLFEQENFDGTKKIFTIPCNIFSRPGVFFVETRSELGSRKLKLLVLERS